MSMHHSEWSFNIVKLFLISGEGKTYLTRLHSPNRLVLGVMRDIRSTMEEIVDTVATIRSNDRTAVRSCNRLAESYDRELLLSSYGERRDGNGQMNDIHCLSNVTEESTRFTDGDSSVETFSSCSHELE